MPRVVARVSAAYEKAGTVLGMTLNSSVVVLSMTFNSCGAIEEMILCVAAFCAAAQLIFLFGRT